jgi:ATP-dependent RNA helicase DHX57
MAMTLPPSIRPYWSTLTAEKATAPDHRAWEWHPDPFAAKKEVEERQSKRQAKEKAKEEEDTDNLGGIGISGSGRSSTAGRERIGGGREWDGVPEVRMAPGLRETVEATVRKVSKIVWLIADGR